MTGSRDKLARALGVWFVSFLLAYILLVYVLPIPTEIAYVFVVGGWSVSLIGILAGFFRKKSAASQRPSGIAPSPEAKRNYTASLGQLVIVASALVAIIALVARAFAVSGLTALVGSLIGLELMRRSRIDQ